MLDYSLCTESVTLEGKRLDGVWMEGGREVAVENGRERARGRFLLIVPGDCAAQPGDTVTWRGQGFTVACVEKRYLHGRLCHTEIKG